MRTPNNPDLGTEPETTTDTAMSDAWRAVLALHGDDADDWSETDALDEPVVETTSETSWAGPNRTPHDEESDRGR